MAQVHQDIHGSVRSDGDVTIDRTTKMNGVDVESLVKTVEAVANEPNLGAFEFRCSTQWKEGAVVESTFTGHKQNGVNSDRQVPHRWGGDEPIALLGKGLYQGPTDTLLHSMAHCLTVTLAYQGSVKGIPISKIVVDSSGIVNLEGFLGLNPRVRPGFKHIHMQVSIESPATAEEVADLFNYAQGLSPVVQSVRNSVPINFNFNVENNGAPAYKEDTEDRHGVSYEGLINTVEAAKADPNNVKAKFFARTEWCGGAQVKSTFEKCEIPANSGTFHYRDEPLVLVADEPAVLLGKDSGPGPTETMLHGVGNCVSVCQSYHAGVRGIPVEDFKLDFHGDVDLQGFMDLNDQVRRGYKSITVHDYARAGGQTDEELLEFYKQMPNMSPVCDTVRNPVHVTFGLNHRGAAATTVQPDQ